MSSRVTTRFILPLVAVTSLIVLVASLHSRRHKFDPFTQLGREAQVLYPSGDVEVVAMRIMTTRTEYWIAGVRDGGGKFLKKTKPCESRANALEHLREMMAKE
jgi:hypothetical protein